MTVLIRRDFRLLNATIAVGQSLSNALDVRQYAIFQLLLPAGMEGTTLTFQTCDTYDGTFADLYENGTEVSLTVAAGRAESLDTIAGALAGALFLKVRTGTSASPTVQAGADAVLRLVCKG